MKIKIKNKKIFGLLSLVFFLGVFFLFPNLVHAGLGETVATVLGWVLYPIIWVLGQILIMLIYILIGIAQYNDFINSNAVTFGWQLVRDLCNMFFILILLIIAFATILRVEQYNLKTWLPKLLLMAVLINFSKLICGIFIDVTQVIMLTFVNAFKDMAGGNLTEMLGVTKILNFDQGSAGDVTGWTILGSIILALIFSIVSVVVVLTMLIMLAMRIIMIWIYIVLSPLAYLLASFPQGQAYSQRWWSDFSKNLIVGPILAFFIWLSFASLGGIEGSRDINKMSRPQDSDGSDTGESYSASITEAGSQDNMTKFIISIGMLLGGLMIAQEMGGVAGSVAGKGMAKLQAMGSGTMNAVANRVSTGAKRASGLERAQNAYSAYRQQKDSKRSELAQRDASKLMRAEEKIKKGVAYIPDKGRQLVDGGLKSMIGVNRVQNRINEAKNTKTNLEERKLKVEIEQKGNINEGQKMISQANNLESTQERYNELKKRVDARPNDLNAREEFNVTKTNLEAMKRTAGLSVGANEKEVKQKVKQLRNEGTAKVKPLTDLESQISEQTKKISEGEKSLESRKKWSERAGKGAAIVGGAITGGLVGGGIPGAIIGGVASVVGRRRLMHAGEEAADLSSDYNSSQISKYKDGMKDDSESDIRKKMSDYSLNSHERTAATMVLMEKGKLSQEEALVHRDKVKNSYGYDNKVMNQLDSSLNGDYQNLTRDFSSLNTEEKSSKKYKEANEKIVKGIVGGTIKLENVDKKSMELIMPGLVKTVSNKKFKSHFDDLTKPKQREVRESLRASGDYDSLKKLATINDSDINSFDRDTDKVKFMADVEIDEVRKMVTKTESAESLKKFLSESSLAADLRTAGNSGDEKEFVRKLNEMLKSSNLSLDSGPERAIIKRFQEIMGVSFTRPQANNRSNNQNQGGV